MDSSIEPPNRPPSSISDPQRIRALAHPVRIELLDLLGDEEATATRCAEVTGESVASCSFHLRTLAKYGFIERAEQCGKEKPWRLVERSRTITPDWDDPTSVRAVQEFAALDVEREAQRLLCWVREADQLPHEWTDATTMLSASVWATREELAELSRTISALGERFRGRREDPSLRPAGARKVRIFAATTVDTTTVDTTTVDTTTVDTSTGAP
jgi:DNA-binding transcriptional ArsR family regulator